METDRFKLHDKIDNFSGTIRDIDIQQRAHHVAINGLEHGCLNLPGDADQDTITDARIRVNDGILPNPHRLPHASLAASVLDLRHADRDAPAAPCSPAEGHHAGCGSVPRFYKLSFPLFDGQEDLLPWLNRCDQFFRGQHTMAEDKVWLVTFHMTSSAQLWYHRLEHDTGTPSWCRFVELVNTRFGPPLRSNLLGELIVLRKQGTARDFSDQLLALLCRTGPLTEYQQIQLFTVGLGQPLQMDVELQAPQSLESAMSLARAYERRT